MTIYRDEVQTDRSLPNPHPRAGVEKREMSMRGRFSDTVRGQSGETVTLTRFEEAERNLEKKHLFKTKPLSFHQLNLKHFNQTWNIIITIIITKTFFDQHKLTLITQMCH